MPTTSATSVTRRATAGFAALAATAAAVSVAAARPAEAADRPLLKVPFPCHQTWRGSTWAGHSPSDRAMDLNLPPGGDTDLGKPVKASAAGKVVSAGVGGGGYGNRVLIGHGNNWSTFYAHLSRIDVKVGQHVEATTTIGAVGKSGGQSSAHLHYEQRHHGTPVSIRFGSSTWATYYSNTQTFTRTRC
ncbi:M23 family metallopeptidase [Phycicoccus sp.]|uniref:M23 family metallopeptidase n=1 Tax=Phycicoccus sp. TaxID=1902410 RepID=UPI002C0733B7|nr:M23 family metallopeptidase [Phycicoccus sp.]HMM95029.1 M23 family metallopeptidase [Phycicoccus sp.]